MSANPEERSASQVTFAVGERVRIVRTPGLYGYNGRSARVIAVSGVMITLDVEDPPSDVHCTIFYAGELEHEDDA